MPIRYTKSKIYEELKVAQVLNKLRIKTRKLKAKLIKLYKLEAIPLPKKLKQYKKQIQTYNKSFRKLQPALLRI